MSVMPPPPVVAVTPVRAIVLMIVAMAGFAFADMFIKIATAGLGTGQIIATLGMGGTLIFGGLAAARGQRLFGPDLWHPTILFRMCAETIATFGFTAALALTTLSAVTAVMQAAPLAVTLGAALILGEPVGWRRWCAVIVGFAGVMIMLSPGADGVNFGALVALLAVLGLSARDLSTRFVPDRIPNLVLATYGFVAMIPTGLVLAAMSGDARLPDPVMAGALAGMILFAVIAYFALTLSLRLGSMAVVAPFRYTRIIFAFALGMVVLGDRLTPQILIGAALVAGAGIYTFWREGRLRRRALARASVPPGG